MLKKYWKTLLVTSLVTLLPIVFGLLLWQQLPEEVPFHWNVHGEVDGWCSRVFFVYFLPLIMLAFHWFCIFITSADPKKAGIKAQQLVFWLIPILNLALSAFVYMSALGHSAQIEVFLPLILGLLFVIIGNYMPKCQQNHSIGYKLPWTLNSEENWNKTHRFAGWLMVGGGFVIIATSILGIIWLPLVILAIMAIVPIIYSYLLHKKGI